jgi:glycosyltransferase involved in cell wall biosynthesis
MKVLVLSPYFDKPGGVAMYFFALKSFLGSNYSFFFRGNRTTNRDLFVLLQYFLDYLRFGIRVLRKKDDIYLVNTSFAPTGCGRDQVYIQILKLLNRKVVVFFHGWNKPYEAKIDNLQLASQYPLKAFKKADAIVVLADEFRGKLISWGFRQPIYLETTVVDSMLTRGIKRITMDFDLASKPFVFLLVARIEREKGVFEAVDLFQEVQKVFPAGKFEFKIAGDGSSLQELKTYVQIKKVENVQFLGYVSGEAKKEAFSGAHMFLFPSSHGEGMPISLLEAMAFGLPLLTTQVGGIKDFFQDGIMGVALSMENLKGNATIDRIAAIIADRNELEKISRYNFEFAKQRFYAEAVSRRLHDVLKENS